MFANIVFKPRNQVNCKQSEFFSNNNNKTALSKALTLKLRAKGHVLVECNVKVMLTELSL